MFAPTAALQTGSFMMWIPILALILRDLGATDLQVSLAAMAWTASEALAQYLGGRLSDRIGRWPIIVWTGYLAAAGFLFGAYAPHWILFVLANVFVRGIKGLQTPVFPAIIGESVTPRLRGSAFGVVEMFIATAAVAGPVIGARLVPVMGAQRLLAITAIAWAISALVRQRFLKETRPADAGSTRFSLRQVLQPPLREMTLVLIGFQMMMSITLWGPFMALHAVDVMGITRTQINVFYAVGTAVGAASSPFWGPAVIRFGLSRILSTSALVYGLSALLWSFQSGVSGIIGAYILMGISFQAIMVTISAYRLAAVPDQFRGAGIGASGMISSFAAALFVPVVGYLRAWGGPFVPFVMAAFCGVFIYFALKRSQVMTEGPPSVRPRDEQGVGPEGVQKTGKYHLRIE